MSAGLLQVLTEDRVLALPRLPRIDDPAALVGALAAGGIRVVEFAFTTPGVERAIAAAAGAAGTLVGAGTVLDAEQVHRAADAGARFLVTPGVRAGVAEAAAAVGLPVVMGALTPTEVVDAAGLGAVAVKIFPAETVGPAYFRHLAGPLPDVPLVASGGVDAGSAPAYLSAGALAVTAGSGVVRRTDVEAGDWAAVTAAAAAFTAAVR